MSFVISGTQGISSDGIRFINIDSAGRLQNLNVPAFYAQGFPADLYATAANQQVPITFRDCRLNQGNHWNGSVGSSTNNGNRFTAPVTGVYYFAWEAMFKHAGGGDNTMQVWKNGGVVSYNNCHFKDNAGYYPNWTMAQVNWIGSLAAGDYIDFRFSCSADGTTYYYAGGLYNKCFGWQIS